LGKLGIAKIFGLEKAPDAKQLDLGTAKSMTDIGRRLLQSVGLREPDDASVQDAIEANNAFVARLEQIKARAEGTLVVG
jgi:hypothetical protein